MSVATFSSGMGVDGSAFALPRRWLDGSVELPHYKVGRFVGSGAMGAVFEGHDKRSGERVALKTLLSHDADGLINIKREFRAVADLAHPNLALAHELAFDEEVPYLVMEFVDGVDFLSHVTVAEPNESRTRSTTGGPRPFSTVRLQPLRDALRQLVLGVEALHRVNLLHLDLKPANVLVEQGGRVVVLDFGLVDVPKAADHGGPLALRGTPAYMAPEQCAGFAESAADVYAIGVMLFEALTGTLPFEISSAGDLLRKQRNDAPPVASIASAAPEDLCRLCDQLLDRRPERRPTLEDVLNELGSSDRRSVPSSLVPPSSQPFVGRQSELEALRDAKECALTRTCHVFVGGASGIGKTALLRHFLSEHRDDPSVLVLSSRCYEREAVPYKAVDGLIDALAPQVREVLDEVEDLSALLRVFPALGAQFRAAHFGESPANPQELRQRAFRGLKTLFHKLTASKRVVLAIDDLQWGDLDSARLLREVFGAADSPRVLLLGTYRPGEQERSPCLGELFKPGCAADVRFIKLQEMAEAEACDLVRVLLKDDIVRDDVLVKHVARESGGNPLFVDSLLTYHFVARSSSASSLRDVVAGFMGELSDDGRRLVRLLAVAGSPVPQGVALDAARIDNERHGVFARLRSLHMVRTSGARDSDSAEMYHDRIRESICLELSPTELRGIHESLADALARSGNFEGEQIAHHYHAAGRLLDAAHHALLSAERASALLAFDHAAKLFGLAVKCRPEDSVLHVRYAEALEHAGRSAESAQAFLDSAKRCDPAEAELLERHAARQLLLAGRVQEGLLLLRPHLRRLRLDLPATPASVKRSIALSLIDVRVRGVKVRPTKAREYDAALLSRIDAGIAIVDGLTGGDPMTAACLMLQTLRLALKAHEPSRVAWSLAQYGLFRAASGSDAAVAAGEELLASAEWLSRSLDDPGLDGTLLVARARAALTSGSFPQALSAAEACRQHFRDRRIRNSGLATVAENVALFALEAMGAFQDLGARSEERLRSAEAVGDLYSRITAQTYFSVSALAKGDTSTAHASVSEASGLYPPGSFLFQNWLLLKAQTQLDLYRGEAGVAWGRLRDQWQALEAAHLLRVQFVRVFAARLRGTAAIAALKAGQLPAKPLLASARRDALDLERQRRPYARAAASAIRAGLAAFQGDLSNASLEYTRAAAAYEHAGMPVESACCRLRRSTLPGGSPSEAVTAEEQLSRAGVEHPSSYAVLHAP